METSASQLAPGVAPLRSKRIAVAAIFFTNAVVLSNWIARIPDVKQRLALSDAALGLALLAMAAGALVAQVSAGWLMGRFGSRNVTILMAGLFFLATTTPGLAPSLPLLMLALFLFGAGNGGLDVAMNAQASMIEQSYNRPIMSSFHGLWSVGGLIGASVGGLIAARLVPVELHLLGAALVGAVIIGVATRGLIRDSGHHDAAGPAFALPPRSLLPLGIIALGVLFCEGAVGDWSAVYLRDRLGADPGLAATGYAAFALTMTIGRFAGDWLSLRFGPTLLVRGSGVLITAGILVMLASAAPLGAIAGFALVGAGAACVFPLVLSAAARTPGITPGTAIAAMATAGYTGFLIGPPLIGTIAELVSLRIALGLLGLLGLLVIMFASAIKRAEAGG